MTTRRFFSHIPLTGETLRITGEEYHHLKHVNRARCGDPIEVTDGQGSLFHGEVREMTSDEALVQIKQQQTSPRPPANVIVAPSLLKQRPMNLMVEKLTEIGVDEIRPLIFARTDETYSPSRLKKWNRIAIQSLKVNKRLWLTQIYPPVSIEELVQSTLPVNTKLLLDIPGLSPVKTDPRCQWPLPAIAVAGPPGGIVEEERTLCGRYDFIAYKINHCVLKTETAAISIGAILKLMGTA